MKILSRKHYSNLQKAALEGDNLRHLWISGVQEIIEVIQKHVRGDCAQKDISEVFEKILDIRGEWSRYDRERLLKELNQLRKDNKALLLTIELVKAKDGTDQGS